jgi:hypothetical protein
MADTSDGEPAAVEVEPPPVELPPDELPPEEEPPEEEPGKVPNPKLPKGEVVDWPPEEPADAVVVDPLQTP